MKSIFTYLCLLGGALFCNSCEDYLSELPAKGANQPVKNIDQLIGLLNNPKVHEFDATGSFMTDDTGLTPEFYDEAYTYFSDTEPFYYYTFDTDKLASLASDALWTSLYASIYDANLILENVDEVEGTPDIKEQIKAEAHFLRAYSYWRLANQYCLPYCEKNLSEQGLPLRKTTYMEEAISRTSLEETYRFIDKDLTEALKIKITTTDQPWRASLPTIQAFLSRYYLFRGEYEKAVSAATEALKNSGRVQLKDYNTISAGMSFIPGFLEFPEMGNYSENQVVMWQEFFYAKTSLNTKFWYVPSDELIACYDPVNDLRRRKLFTYNSMLLLPETANGIFLGYNFFYWLTPQIPSGVTIQEVMLNKAEALLRQANPDKSEALELLYDLRRKRYDATSGDNVIRVEAATNDEALRKVLEERRRELPFTHRWFDIRRFSVNEIEWDDVEITRSFYEIVDGAVYKSRKATYTLPAGSRRYAMPINENDISASHGTIKQNEF